MLGEASQKVYERIRKQLLSQFKFPDNYFPSYFILTNSRPKVIPFVVPPIKLSCTLQVDNNVDIDMTSLPERGLVPLVSDVTNKNIDKVYLRIVCRNILERSD